MKATIQFAETCKAQWQVETTFDGCHFIIKCKTCGTTLSRGGTPKCLLPEGEKKYPEPTAAEYFTP